MEDEIEWHEAGADVPTWAIIAWVGAVLAVIVMAGLLTFFPEVLQPARKAIHGPGSVQGAAGSTDPQSQGEER